MAYDLATVTNSGNQLLASVVPDKSSLVIDKIEVSGTQLASSTDLKTMTSISNVVQTLSANGYQKKDNSFIISTVLDNSSVKVDYKAWVFGIWAHKADGGSSILMSVITSTNSPDTISKGSGTPIDYNYKFITTFSNTKSLKIKMSSDTYATNDTVLHNSGDETATGTKTFQEIKISNKKFPSLVQTDGQYVTLDGGNTEIVPADNSKVVHTTGDETIDGKKKFDTDPTDGAGNAYAKTVDVNQQLDKKVNVADMRKPASDVAGIEEVSALQTQVNNSAVGTNLLIGTSPLEKSYTGDFSTIPNWSWSSGQRSAVSAGSTYTYSIYLTKLTGSFIMGYWGYGSNKEYVSWYPSINYSSGGRVSWTFTIPSGISYIIPHIVHASNDFACTAKEEKLELGSHATDWCPNPEDKVNVADMRKPASDVAGIEEVNAKQDKIGYTPANDSKVAHNSGDETLGGTKTFTNPIKGTIEGITYRYSAPGDDLDTSYMNDSVIFVGTNKVANAPAGTSGTWAIVRNYNSNATNGAQSYYDTNQGVLYVRMRNATTTYTPWIQVANDSKVAHLSGANNFDTVPTVNNNPLLLASSLPSDLARTGSNQEFTGKNTFDTAPIDKTTGNPYITKSDVPNWQKHKLTADDGSAKLVIASGEDVNEKLKAIVGTKDTGKLLVDTDAKNNPTGNSLIGEYFCDFDGLVTGYGIGKNGAMWNFTYNGTTTIWKLISSDYFTASAPLPTVDDNIYGVSWDGSSSGALQRTDAAVGLKAGINGAQNDFDTRGPWGLMDKTITDSYGNAFVRVPKFYIRKVQDKSKPLTTWQVSLVKQGDDWYLPNCFYDFYNNKELKYVDVSRYEGSISSGKLQSKTGVTPTNSVDINDFRNAATALNVNGKKGYHLWDVHTLDALQVLFTIEFATLDSQSIMEGNDAGSSAISNGTTDNVKGSSGFAASGAAPMAYRGIENLYGNLAMLTDGLNITNLSLYSCDDATKYVSDTFTDPYYMLNYSLPAYNSGNTNITSLGFDKDHPSVEAPTSYNSDNYNTYYHDEEDTTNSGNGVVCTGGGWTWGAGLSGLWCWNGNRSSTVAYSDVGSRLLKKAL